MTARLHLVGSVPLPDAATAFRTVAGALGPHLSRIPDGEPGERRRWIYFQRLMLERHPAMEPDPTVPLFALRQWDGVLLRETPLLRFRAGVDPEAVHFDTGYAGAARESYSVYRALRDDGVIPRAVRLQVCLPTPMASAYMYVSPHARDAYLTAYGRALRRALDEIVAAIPAADLAIQWDVCQEVLIHEGFFADRPADYETRIADELTALGSAVPTDVEMGPDGSRAPLAFRSGLITKLESARLTQLSPLARNIAAAENATRRKEEIPRRCDDASHRAAEPGPRREFRRRCGRARGHSASRRAGDRPSPG